MKNSKVTFAISLIGFAVALAAIIGTRLSDQAAAMLAGAACSGAITAPLAILAGMYIGAQRAERAQRSTRDRAPAQSPTPIVVVTPQPQAPAPNPALQTWANVQPMPPGMLMGGPRQYTILGEENVIDGTDTVWEQNS